MTGGPRVVYLHGFASSPLSTKAQFFARRFADLGVACDIPQLDEGNFETLTVSGQLRVLDQAVHGDRVILIGSSLGGYLSALYAARHSTVEKVVLMAPAFQFPSRWRSRFSAEEFAEWKSRGSRPFFHYGYKEDRALGYGFVEDAMRYEDEPDFRQPGLILHGSLDDVVPLEASETFARSHPNVRLCVLHSGHELTDVMERMWNETAKFLEFQKQ